MKGPESLGSQLGLVGERRTERARIIRQARAEAAARRARVLAHPDLAQKLTQEPIGYRTPEQWNGYVPPRLMPGPASHDDLLVENQSVRRQALVDLCAEAMRREQAGA